MWTLPLDSGWEIEPNTYWQREAKHVFTRSAWLVRNPRLVELFPLPKLRPSDTLLVRAIPIAQASDKDRDPVRLVIQRDGLVDSQKRARAP